MGQPNYYDTQSPDYAGPWRTNWGGMLGGGSSSTTTAAPKPPSLEDTMKSQAADIVAQENQRYGQGLGTLQSAYAASQAANQPIDPSLLFSKASDAIGARAMGNMNALRSSLGARGLNPNSGAASGLLQRMAFQQGNDVTGAMKDIAIDNQRQRQVGAAQNFANAMNLANYTNAPASGANLETTQNLFEGQIAREGIAAQKSSNKAANKSNILGGLIGAGASILGGLL